MATKFHPSYANRLIAPGGYFAFRFDRNGTRGFKQMRLERDDLHRDEWTARLHEILPARLLAARVAELQANGWTVG